MAIEVDYGNTTGRSAVTWLRGFKYDINWFPLDQTRNKPHSLGRPHSKILVVN